MAIKRGLTRDYVLDIKANVWIGAGGLDLARLHSVEELSSCPKSCAPLSKGTWKMIKGVLKNVRVFQRLSVVVSTGPVLTKDSEGMYPLPPLPLSDHRLFNDALIIHYLIVLSQLSVIPKCNNYGLVFLYVLQWALTCFYAYVTIDANVFYVCVTVGTDVLLCICYNRHHRVL